MPFDLKSIFRINMINLSPLFDAEKTEVEGKKESKEVYEAIATPSATTPKRPTRSESETYQPVDYNSLLAMNQGEGREITIKAPEITVVPKSQDALVVQEVEKSLNISGEDKQTALLSSLVDEQRKQTGLLELGLDPSDTFKSKEVAELRREAETRGHFSRLSQTIEDTQKESAEKISDSVEDMEEKLSDTISAMPVGGGGGLLDDITDDTYIDADGKKKKRKRKRRGPKRGPKGKGSIFKRVLGKGKGVLSKVGTAATSLLPSAAPAALTTTLGTSVSGLAAGGATGLATIGGAALAAGAAGYGVGTLLNKAVAKIAGRDDWLFGWLGDKRDEKADKERKDKSYTKFEKISSPAVLKMMGGKEDFDATKFAGLKFKGLIVWKDGRWYTKSEADLQQVEDINSATKRAEEQTTAMPTHLIDTKRSPVSEEDRAKLEALNKKKEVLLEEYNKDILGDVVKTGYEAQVKRFLSAYEKSEAAYAKADEKQKADIKVQMEQSEAAIKELSGMQRVEVEELYKQKVAETIDKEAKEILDAGVKKIEPMTLMASHVPVTEKRPEALPPKATESFKAGDYTVQGAQAGEPGRLQDIVIGLAEIERLKNIEKEKSTSSKPYKVEPIPLQAAHTPKPSGMERVATSDFKFVESKKDEVIEELRQERLDSLTADLKEAEERQKTTKGFFKRVGIRKEIRELETKKSKIEEMTAQEYKGWLDDAIRDSKDRLKKLKKKRSSMFAFLSRGKIEEAIPKVEKEITVYEAEQARIEAITNRTAAPASAPPRPQIVQETMEYTRPTPESVPNTVIEQTPAEVSTALVNVVREETRAATAEARNVGRAPEISQPQVVPLPQPQREPVPTIRTTKIDDAGVELLRTLISG